MVRPTRRGRPLPISTNGSVTGDVTGDDIDWATSTYSPPGEPIATAHIADTTDAHDASAVSIVDAGGFYASANVEGALQEAASFAGSPNLDGGIASSTYGGIAALNAGGA